jgi:hypothetical protein
MPELMIFVILLGGAGTVYATVYFAVKHAINDSVLGKRATQLMKQNDKP